MDGTRDPADSKILHCYSTANPNPNPNAFLFFSILATGVHRISERTSQNVGAYMILVDAIV